MPERKSLSRNYLLHLLQDRAQWMADRVDAGAEKHGYGNVTPSMSRLFALMVGGPLSVSEAARRLAVSRQAVHKLAADAASLGYVLISASPDDARVRLLNFTAEGKSMARAAEREVVRIEAQLAQALGKKRLETLRELLATPWERQPAVKASRDSGQKKKDR